MICIVNKTNNVIVKSYDASIPILNIDKGLYSDSEQWDHLVAPSGLASNEVKLEDNEIVADLDAIKAAKMSSIRKSRNALLKLTDAKWIEYASKNLDKTAIETDKQTLRDLTTSAQAALDAMTDPQEMKSYDPMASLELSMNYSEE
jgi:hypothetical protein